ncbi:N-acetylmannosamine-6-phosphate 2-epimerase [Cohnella thermotolerans]|jgi:N-acylglucosamine-6-phosphate 2-epimerase|uniref:N-acetylmannosamine-6-phosphate 2-epimerase n=1 Tax=Cohnella thermotolerans TaxID=329858 RepID=UPI000406DF25|nr:N-acetylmannosamine-6-phosphate 2-epimerase [Cohnella thermotolerans]
MRRTFQKSGLIVSCQALPDEPLHGAEMMKRMAVAAEQGGAVGIRANGTQDIRAIKEAVEVPVIGIIKRDIPGSAVYITPEMEDVRAILEAGADIVALDMTDREGRLSKVKEMIDFIHAAGAKVMADISVLEEGMAAERLGSDIISTTLSGYTPYSPRQAGPDLELVKKLTEKVSVPVAAEGRIWSEREAVQAMRLGASYVVVGAAITRPHVITKRYAERMDEWLRNKPRAGNW